MRCDTDSDLLAMTWTKDEVVEFLQSIGVDSGDIDSTYGAFCADGFVNNETYLKAAIVETLSAAGVSLAVISLASLATLRGISLLRYHGLINYNQMDVNGA